MRRKRDRELDEELRSHFRMAVEDRIRRGEDPREAERSARREFGNELLVREVTRAMWGRAAWERLAQDFKYALRQMRRSPGFTAVAVVTLALGLGATSTIFSIVNGVLLQPLAFRQPERLYVAENIPPARAHLTRNFPVNARHFDVWRCYCRSCEDVALFAGANLTLVGVGETARLPALEVSFNFFRTLGVHPAIGRDFLPQEEGSGFDKVILSDRLWRDRFEADPAVLGRRIEINGEAHTIIGIMPPGLHLPEGPQWGAFVGPAAQPLIFRPLTRNVSREAPAGNLNYTSVVRLKAGVTPERAAAELNSLIAGFVREYGIETDIGLTSLRDRVVRGERAPLLLLLGAVAAVLLIVCLNIGNLMLVRTTSRYREAGVRLALGASRAQLFRLVLVEALALVTIGGLGGLALARVGLKSFIAAAPVTIPRLAEVRIDWRVAAFGAVAIVFSAIVCGLAPAWRLARIEPLESLKAGGGNASESAGKLWFREVMVGLEVALSTVLLVAGGLLMVSFFRLVSVPAGFDVEHVMTQEVSFLSPKYAHGVRRGFVEQMLQEIAQIPGVQASGATSHLPLMGDETVGDLRDPDNTLALAAAIANFRFVTPGYFKALGIPLRRGRLLEEADRNRPTAVVSEQAAHALWGNQDPIGKHVEGAGPRSPALEVVGVVGDVRNKLEQNPPMMVYEHFWRMQPIAMSFVLRTRSDPAPVGRALRLLLATADPDMALSPARTMDQIMYASVAARRFQMALSVAFALAALALASLGTYGVVSFAVARRTREMGIRIALGAGATRLVLMVMAQGMIPIAGGLAAGLAGALAAGRLIASQLYGVSASDPLTMSAVAAILVVVGACACSIPAMRATRIDPMTALRFE